MKGSTTISLIIALLVIGLLLPIGLSYLSEGIIVINDIPYILDGEFIFITSLTVLLPILIVIGLVVMTININKPSKQDKLNKCEMCIHLNNHDFICLEGFDLEKLGINPLYCKKFIPNPIIDERDDIHE